jgi:nuclear GTP-binding protein
LLFSLDLLSHSFIIVDLVPREVVEQWLKFLRNHYPTIAFKSSTQLQRKNLGHQQRSTHSVADINTSECLGADTLMKLLKNYASNRGLKTAITVGIIGYPNVGKSSVINSLKRAKAVGVGATPGFTKVSGLPFTITMQLSQLLL